MNTGRQFMLNRPAGFDPLLAMTTLSGQPLPAITLAKNAVTVASSRCSDSMKSRVLPHRSKAMFGVLAEHCGLKPSDYGWDFKARRETFRIMAINPNRPKYPISVERVADGRGFKFFAEDVTLYLRNAGGNLLPEFSDKNPNMQLRAS